MTFITYLTNSIDALFAAYIYTCFHNVSGISNGSPHAAPVTHAGGDVYIGLPGVARSLVINNHQNPSVTLSELMLNHVRMTAGGNNVSNIDYLKNLVACFKKFESSMDLGIQSTTPDGLDPIELLKLFGLYNKIVENPTRKTMLENLEDLETSTEISSITSSGYFEKNLKDGPKNLVELGLMLLHEFYSKIITDLQTTHRVMIDEQIGFLLDLQEKDKLSLSFREKKGESGVPKSKAAKAADAENEAPKAVATNASAAPAKASAAPAKASSAPTEDDTPPEDSGNNKPVRNLHTRRENPYLLKLYAALIMNVFKVPFVIIKGYFPARPSTYIAFGNNISAVLHDFNCVGSPTTVTFDSSTALPNVEFRSLKKLTTIISTHVEMLNSNVLDLIRSIDSKKKLDSEITKLMTPQPAREPKVKKVSDPSVVKNGKTKAAIKKEKDEAEGKVPELSEIAKQQIANAQKERDLKLEFLKSERAELTTELAAFKKEYEKAKNKHVDADTFIFLFEYLYGKPGLKTIVNPIISVFEGQLVKFGNKTTLSFDRKAAAVRAAATFYTENRPESLCNQRARNAFMAISKYIREELEGKQE